MKGIINLNKPSGITSHTAVSKVRKILGVKSAGHMGTLDSAGEGVLLIGLGKATRLFDYYLKKDKTYEAEFTFGYQTDTLDGEGEVIITSEYIPTINQLTTALEKLIGEQMQLPPKYSAKLIDGVRAYKLARSGKEVNLTPAKVQIYSADVLEYNQKVCRIKIHCSSGTYIRSLCRDLAKACGSVATMTAIIRCSIGQYTLADSFTLEQLIQMGSRAVQPIEDALSGLNRIDLDISLKKKLDNGVKITFSEAEIGKQSDYFTVYCQGILYGIAAPNDLQIDLKTYLKD